MSERGSHRSRLSAGSRGWLIVTLMLTAVAVAVALGQPPQAPPSASHLWGFEAQGHRGARGLLPENTLPAFAKAIELEMTTLELDVGLSSEGVPVVLHDRRLNPDLTRDDSGAWLAAEGPAVKDLSLVDLARYDVGRVRPDSRLARRFPRQEARDGTRVPTLAEVLALGEERAGGGLRYNIETKLSPLDPDSSPDPDALATAVVSAVRAAGVEARAMVQSFDWRTLSIVQRIAPEIVTAYLTAQRDWLDNLEMGRPGASPWTAGLDADAYEGSVPAMVAAAGGRIWSPYYRDLRRGDLEEAHRHGLAVVVWTVNKPGDMERLIDDGVDGLITDYPDLLRKVLEAKGFVLERETRSYRR